MLKHFTRVLRRCHSTTTECTWNISNKPELDLNFLFDEKNLESILKNVEFRKGVGDIKKIHSLKNKLSELNCDSEEYNGLKEDILREALRIPNFTHPDVLNYGKEPKIIKYLGKKREFEHEPYEFHEIGRKLNLIRTAQLGPLAGSRSYYVLGELAELEHALVQYTLANLIRKQFKVITVPDILHQDIVERCGMATRGVRNQIYFLDKKLHDENLCLSGTSEMALGGHFSNKTISVKDLPIKIATVSRCYRAEVSSVAEEKGIYRVHQFTKVEMFALSHPNSSEKILEEFLNFEEESFSNLGLYLRTLDMPPCELGAPAYRKYDIEAWLPGRKMFGELSSCSNCTDYQARRLGIKYRDNDKFDFVHTLNGTACAIPRMLISIVETNQNSNGTITVPDVLLKYMKGKKFISKQRKIPELRLIKNKKNI